MRQSTWRTLSVALALSLAAAACNGDDGEDGEEGAQAQTVSFLHVVSGEAEQAALDQAIGAFEEATGHTVEAEFTDDFNTVIATRIAGGNPPDVGLYPQPGLLQEMVDRGGVQALDDADLDEDNLVPGMVETGTFEDTTYGVVVNLGVKSLVWYPKAAFDEAGYQVPETWDDLVSLTEEISGTGTPAWCIGIESGGDTGWPATDWIEDIMLRLHGPDVYDQWTTNDVAFDSQEVREAFERAEEIWFGDGYVVGGPTGIVNTNFLDAPDPMFQDPPGCFLHKQMGFIEGEFPGEFNTDHDVFFLPPIDESVGTPALFAGNLAAVHTDNPAAIEFIEFLVSAEGQEAWHSHEGSGNLSIRSDFDTANYPSDSLAAQGEAFAAADFARFDGSDLMPGEVGAGTFWSETVRWLGGAQDLDTTLSNIQASWPS